MTTRPHAWHNWRQFDAKVPWTYADEYKLYSDGNVHGVARSFGPIHFAGLLARDVKESSGARPVAIVRVHHSAPVNPHDDDVEHGGQSQDEIAALCSLIWGIRVKAGDKSRSLTPGDLTGRAYYEAEVKTPHMPVGAWTPIIRHAMKTVDLCDLNLLSTYPTLSDTKASALLRAARLYQDGLWVAEREPWLTWILFGAAIETASNCAIGKDRDYVTALRELAPELANVAEKYGEECLKAIAKQQSSLVGAKKKFMEFLKKYRPARIAQDTTDCRHPWTDDALKKSLTAIYSVRSKYLHEGIPVPWELCLSPEFVDGGLAECIEDRSERYGSGIPDLEMMHLFVFEHLVRGSLLLWWASPE